MWWYRYPVGPVIVEFEASSDEGHEEDDEPAAAATLAEERERDHAEQDAGDGGVDAGHEVVDGGVRLRPGTFVDREAHRPGCRALRWQPGRPRRRVRHAAFIGPMRRRKAISASVGARMTPRAPTWIQSGYGWSSYMPARLGPACASRIDENPTLRVARSAALPAPRKASTAWTRRFSLGVGGEVELAEDAAHVRFDRLAGDEELLGDAAVGLALGDQREHLALAWCELGERVAGDGRAEKLFDERGLDDGSSGGDLLERGDERGDVGDPILEQVADPLARPR